MNEETLNKIKGFIDSNPYLDIQSNTGYVELLEYLETLVIKNQSNLK